MNPSSSSGPSHAHPAGSRGSSGGVSSLHPPVVASAASSTQPHVGWSEDEMGGDGSTDSEHYDDEMMSGPGEGDAAGTGAEDLTSQLASAGPTGMAAAAAISSTKKRRRRRFTFETNPSIRKRQQTRLLRKLKQNIEEYSLRVGQQAVVLVATPGKSQQNFRAFGAKPLEDVVKNLRAVIMTELETALAQQTPSASGVMLGVGGVPASSNGGDDDDATRHELPALVVDGIPTPVEKMTQAQLRTFIPLMLKYSTGRGKPGWGKDTTRPAWWPKCVPWANVRMDARREDDKQKVSWTIALRQIVINCYRFHGREDLLPAFTDEEEDTAAAAAAAAGSTAAAAASEAAAAAAAAHQHLEQNLKKTETLLAAGQILATTNPGGGGGNHPTGTSQFAPSVIQTISNPDGTVSIIQVDPAANPVITLPDGTTAQIQNVVDQGHSLQGVHTLAEVATAQQQQLQQQQQQQQQQEQQQQQQQSAEGGGAQEGHIIFAGDDVQGYPVSVGGMITVPVPANMYQAMVQQQQQQQQQQQATQQHGTDGTVQVVGTPISLASSGGVVQRVVTKVEPGGVANREPPATATVSSAAAAARGLTITPVSAAGTGGGAMAGSVIQLLTAAAASSSRSKSASSTSSTTQQLSHQLNQHTASASASASRVMTTTSATSSSGIITKVEPGRTTVLIRQPDTSTVD